MKLLLEPPIWYSQDKMYVSAIKQTDISLMSDPIHESIAERDKIPSKTTQNAIRDLVVDLILPQIDLWFTIPMTKDSLSKRLQFQFEEFTGDCEANKWVKYKWVPRYFQVRSKIFTLSFVVESILEAIPRIPIKFLEPVTPRATTPTEVEETTTQSPKKEVRNIVLHPGAGPNEDELLNGIPFTEDSNSLKLRDGYLQEKKKLREAQIRAAIARLKVEKLKERYLREYGDEAEESSESSEDSMEESEFSDASSKK